MIDYNSIEKRIEKQFSSGFYYEYIVKTFVITPNSKTGMFKIEQTTEVSQNRLSALSSISDTLELTINYRHEEVARKVGFDYFTINDIDYTHEINKQPAKIDVRSIINETFPFIRRFIIDNIPTEEKYIINRKITRMEELPIYRSTYGLKYPSKKVHFHFRITGEEKDKWRILSNFSLPFRADLRKEKNFIQSITDESVDITVNEWCLRGSGFMLVVIPKKEQWNYWQD